MDPSPRIRAALSNRSATSSPRSAHWAAGVRHDGTAVGNAPKLERNRAVTCADLGFGRRAPAAARAMTMARFTERETPARSAARVAGRPKIGVTWAKSAVLQVKCRT